MSNLEFTWLDDGIFWWINGCYDSFWTWITDKILFLKAFLPLLRKNFAFEMSFLRKIAFQPMFNQSLTNKNALQSTLHTKGLLFILLIKLKYFIFISKRNIIIFFDTTSVSCVCWTNNLIKFKLIYKLSHTATLSDHFTARNASPKAEK